MKKDPALLLIALTCVIAFVAILVLFLTGCDEDSCEPEELRCRGERSEICNASGEWEFIANCDAIEGGGEWTCCLGYNPWSEENEYGCYLFEECIDD